MNRSLALLMVGLAMGSASGADWPQFLGPGRLSLTPDIIAPWKEPLQPVWRQSVGEGHSAPVIAGGVVYLFQKPKKQQADELAAYDLGTGQQIWKKSFPRSEFSNIFGDGPRGTPTVAEGAVYTLGSTGVLARWDAKTGELAWKRDLLTEFQASNLTFGISTSPTVIGSTVLVMLGGPKRGIVGFDTTTGKTLWQVTDDPASYATPLPLAIPNGTAATTPPPIIFLTGSHLRAVTPLGAELWAVPFKDRLNESSTTPVQAGDLLIAGSVTAGAIAVRPKPDHSAAEVVWRNRALTMYFSTPVLAGGKLFVITGAATLTNPAVHLHCVEPESGKVLWTREKVGKYHAALLRTGNEQLLMFDDSGTLTLFSANPQQYAEICRAKLCADTWAHPAISNRRLVIRDGKELLAYDFSTIGR